MKLNDKVYNVLKWLALVVIPAFSTLYYTLSQVWGFPNGAEIVATLAAVETFIGAMIGVSTATYNQHKE